MRRRAPRPNLHAVRQWAELTELGIRLMRAGVRSKHPRLDDDEVTARLRARLARLRRLSLAAYRRNA